MPGPYIHMSAMRAVTEALSQSPFLPSPSHRINVRWTGEDTKQLGQLMKDHPNFASLGAIGPDLFFFLPDFRDEKGVPLSSVLVAVLRFLEDLYKTLDPYIAKYEEYLGPLSENMDEEISRLTGGLSEAVSNVAGELVSILITALEDFVTQQDDHFKFFSLGLNKGYDEQAFFWSDMLHYRQTGRFGHALWKQAQAVKDADERNDARAYVLGYLTHLATDVTGHAFVNSISGGPFRLHWQRHHLVENHMDAFWCKADPLRPGHGDQYPQLTESALYYDIAFADGTANPVQRPAYPTGGTLRENYRRRRLLDLDSALPSPLADVIINAIIDVFYQDGKHPAILRDNDGRPSSQLIEDTYDLLFRFLKLTTLDGFSHERPDPPEVWPNLDFPIFSDPQEDAPGSGGGDDDDGNWWDDVLDFILSVVKVILYALQVALWFGSLPFALLSDVVTYPLRLGLYYALELPLFHMLKAFRSVLVMTGYFAPMDDEIAVGLIYVGRPDAQIFADVLIAIGDIFPGLEGNPVLSEEPHRDNLYPRLHPEDEYKHPWEYPLTKEIIDPQTGVPYPRQEKAATSAGPFPLGAGPDVLFDNVPSDPGIRDALEQAENPAVTDQIGQTLKSHKHLGDAVNFSQYLVWLVTRDNPQRDGTEVPLVDWNLDADRGYGYHDWDWNRDAHATVNDPERNLYHAPCTWPSQAEDGTYHPEIPLQIHWVGRDKNGHELPDPGCHQLTVEALLVSSFEGDLPPLGSNEPAVFHYRPSAVISAGSRWRGRIILTGPATNNLFVHLTSSHPAFVSVPSPIQVLPGSIKVDFEGPSTGLPNETVEVTVTASLNSISKTAKVILSVSIVK
jgi:hypothetical protein